MNANQIYGWFAHQRAKIKKTMEPTSHPPLLYQGNRNFNKECLKVLNDAYDENYQPSKASRERISMIAGISAESVRHWFTEQRRKRGQIITRGNDWVETKTGTRARINIYPRNGEPTWSAYSEKIS